MIEHVAIWARCIDSLKEFYTGYFNCQSNQKYTNSKNQFSSYFLSFSSGARIELMQMPGIVEPEFDVESQRLGLIHIALSVGSKSNVDLVFEKFQRDNIRTLDKPHHTGDGYYEFTFLDPEGNRVEVTI